jgi:Sulfotransferase family
MTGTRSAGLSRSVQVQGDHPLRAAGSGNPAGRAPVVVLATAYSGAGLLQTLLDRFPGLACTSGTGILPLCEQAMAAWRNAEGRPGGSPSPLAVTSTRGLTGSIITSVLARAGRLRWCEVSSAMPEMAETFLQVYPSTRFLCLYRACPSFIRATLDASPWGITDPLFGPFSRAYPANTVAALTAYWATYTASLLAFEQAHPQVTLRIRYEDLAGDADQTAEAVMSFLDIAGFESDIAVTSDSPTPPEPGPSSPETDLPAGLIPPAMLTQANDLLQQLGYAPLRTTVAR